MVRQVILAPAATLAPLMDRIQREVAAVLAGPATRTRLAELGAERLVGNTPAEAQRFVAQEMARWAIIRREAGVRAG